MSKYQHTLQEPKDEAGHYAYPPVFDEAFPHPVESLIERFDHWNTVLGSLVKYLESQKETENNVINSCLDASKALKQTILRPSVVNSIDTVAAPEDEFLKRVSAKFDLAVERFEKLDHEFMFDYFQQGGVSKNLDCLADQAEQMARTWERHLPSVNVAIADAENVLKNLELHRHALRGWVTDFAGAEMAKRLAIEEYGKLVDATEKFKLNRDMTPLPENDPVVRWITYRSIRDSYVSKVNDLKLRCVVLQDECRQCESGLQAMVQHMVQGYMDSNKAYNAQVKAVFSKHKLPIDANEEWKTFEANGTAVETPPFQQCLPREIQFANQDHPRTKPLAELNLLLHARFPWSLKSKRLPKRYVLTDAGYLIKASNAGTNPIPKRAFRLKDCAVVESLPRNGWLTFHIKGSNSCRDNWTSLFDKRDLWKFSGEEKEVGEMLREFRLRMPIIPYPMEQMYM
jgi:hypothetical protein